LGIAVLVRKDWKNRIINYEWILLRILKLTLKFLIFTVTITGIYTPVEGKISETEESIKMNIIYWPETLLQELVLSQLISA
jgi:hypothetical protein